METQISQPQEYTDAFKQNLTYIFLSVRVNLKETFQCETPCNTWQVSFETMQTFFVIASLYIIVRWVMEFLTWG